VQLHVPALAQPLQLVLAQLLEQEQRPQLFGAARQLLWLSRQSTHLFSR
jgi:hypothetical protein